MKKRIIATILVFCLIFSIMQVAFANFSGFPLRQSGHKDPSVTNSSDKSYSYVRAIQTIVKYWGVDINNDGNFGPATKSAVQTFQSAYGYSSDGIVGSGTWNALYNRLYAEEDTGLYSVEYTIIKRDGTRTNTHFFSSDYNSAGINARETWDVYKAAAGTALGTWYSVNH